MNVLIKYNRRERRGGAISVQIVFIHPVGEHGQCPQNNLTILEGNSFTIEATSATPLFMDVRDLNVLF